MIIASLFVSCDSGILSDVVQSTPKIDISYKNIIALKDSTVYFQTSDGIWSANAGATNKKQLYVNAENYLVGNTAMLKDKNDYILFTSGNVTDHPHQIRTLSLSTGNAIVDCTVQNGSTELTTDQRISNLYNNGMVLVYDTSAKTYTILTGDYSVSGTSVSYPTAITLNNANIISTSSDVTIDISHVCQQTGMENRNDQDFIVSYAKKADTNSGTSYYYRTLLVKNGTDTPVYMGELSYQVAGFVKDHGGSYYLFCTNGYVYKWGGDGTTTLTEVASSISMEPNAFLYHVYANSYNYVIAKSSTKSSGLYVYKFSDGATSFESGLTVRKGYATKLSSDLVTGSYILDTSSATDRLLVGTNESGMVTITINKDTNINSNSDSNGSSTSFEGYVF